MKKLERQLLTDGINKAYLGVSTRARLTAYLSLSINTFVASFNRTSTEIIFVSHRCHIKDARYI